MNKLLFGIVASVFSLSALAAPPPAPDQVVQNTTAQLQDLLHKNHDKYKADSDLFYKVVDDVVVPHFDVRYIAQLVLARHWRDATPDQRTRFQNAFKNMLIRSYANAMLEYHDSVKAEWKPLRMTPDATDVIVNSSLVREGKQPVPIGFSMHLVDNDWKIYDIIIENISLITNFRSQFNGEIKKTNLEDVIVRMEHGDYSTANPKGTGAPTAATSRS